MALCMYVFYSDQTEMVLCLVINDECIPFTLVPNDAMLLLKWQEMIKLYLLIGNEWCHDANTSLKNEDMMLLLHQQKRERKKRDGFMMLSLHKENADMMLLLHQQMKMAAHIVLFGKRLHDEATRWGCTIHHAVIKFNMHLSLIHIWRCRRRR